MAEAPDNSSRPFEHSLGKEDETGAFESPEAGVPSPRKVHGISVRIILLRLAQPIQP